MAAFSSATETPSFPYRTSTKLMPSFSQSSNHNISPFFFCLQTTADLCDLAIPGSNGRSGLQGLAEGSNGRIGVEGLAESL
ncbi:hypothetical protein L2E82_39700 [Cichorium intybus]|uniref:Uncharacterized protein n=1 Tax=Cichorium intybus TaxID=13427 RepID=A0ACB9ANB5_CICIN|nr:hypothetical protein L2E82_39700 [Cichorium intybus]